MPRALTALMLFAATAGALAQSCEAFGADMIEVAGFGLAHFGELSYSSRTDIAQLSGGVCMVSETQSRGEPAWQVIAVSMEVVGLQEEPRFSLSRATLELPDWKLFANRLDSAPQGFLLQELSFEGDNVRGRAESARYSLATGGVDLTNVTARGESFRVSGAAAEVDGARLLFREAEITTCLCEGGALYVLAAPTAAVDLMREAVMIRGGRLKIGGLEIALADELELSRESLENLSFPIQLVTTRDAGLTLRTVPLPLAEGLGLELGLSGLDGDSPRGVFLVHVASPEVGATFGLAPLGFQADVRREEALAEGLSLAFGIRNRHWDEADYLHEGYLDMAAAVSRRGFRSNDQIDLSAGVTAAASSQVIGDSSVLSPRLNLRARASYSLARTAAGTFGVGVGGALSYYPRYDALQYGLDLTPSWQARFGPLSASVRYERQLTNSASPFSTTLDRLTPRSLLFADTQLAGDLASGVEGELGAGLRYNFRADGVDDNAVETAKVAGSMTFGVGEGTLRPSIELELAQLLGSAEDPDVKAYLAGGLAYESPRLETGVYLKYDFEEPGLDALELFLGMPLDTGPVTVHPFLALDFADSLAGTGPLELAGHGLELTFHGCCGVLNLGYRMHRDTFTSTVRLDLPAGQD